MTHIEKIRSIYTDPSGEKSTHYILPEDATWTKLNPNAIDPVRDSILDIGYTLSIVDRLDGRVEDEIGRVNWFTTYINVSAPNYYHFELIPHPDLDRTGYSFLNAPKIVYNGEEIKIPLMKNGAEGTDDLQLPFNAGILVLRETENCEIKLNKPMSSNNNTPNRKVSQNPYAMPQPTFEPVVTQPSTRGGKRGRGRGKNTTEM